MRFSIICLFSILCISISVRAQKINITLPSEANKEYAFVLNKGLDRDTIQQGVLSFAGNVVVNIPDRYKDYAGMGVLLVKNGTSLNLVVNKESFSVNQSADKRYNFDGSLENNTLYGFLQAKKPGERDTTSYASFFIEVVSYLKQLNKVIQQGGSLGERTQVRSYSLNQLDIDKLYTSSLWFYVIDGLTNLTTSQDLFGNDMVHILKRVKSQEVFEGLSNNLITITEQYGLDDAFDIIVPYIEESGRIEVPQGDMYTAFALAKVRKGMVVPSVEGLAKPLGAKGTDRTLLVFYQPGCENCEIQMAELIKHYPQLKDKAIRVVSISADYDKSTFDKDRKLFPWVDKLCDFKGFAGANFVNYGIMATPTFFLIDKDAKLIKRFAQFSDVNF